MYVYVHVYEFWMYSFGSCPILSAPLSFPLHPLSPPHLSMPHLLLILSQGYLTSVWMEPQRLMRGKSCWTCSLPETLHTLSSC